MADTNELILYYEGIEGVINLVVNNPDCSYDDCVQAGVDSSGLSEEIIQNWMNVFINTICDYLKIDASMDNAKQWIITQSQGNSKTVGQICDMLIAMVAAIWDEDGEIIVIRDNQLYRKIQKYNILELDQLQERKEQLENEIDALILDDSELLEWAKENHPQILEVKQLQDELEQIIAKIEELTNLME